MPYRIDFERLDEGRVLRLLDLSPLDIEIGAGGRVAALMPDAVTPDIVARAADTAALRVTPATGRDADSVWRLGPRAVQVGRLRIVPASSDEPMRPGDVRLADGGAFGTGQHPTTALCIEVLGDLVEAVPVSALLDVGTGSGVLSLAALAFGVATATALDVEREAAVAARANARLNDVASRLQVVLGGLDALCGRWPLVVANILAAPLIDMAPGLTAHVAHAGRLVLSGIPDGLHGDVERAYRRVGMHVVEVRTRGGWSAIVLGASW